MKTKKSADFLLYTFMLYRFTRQYGSNQKSIQLVLVLAFARPTQCDDAELFRSSYPF